MERGDIRDLGLLEIYCFGGSNLAINKGYNGREFSRFEFQIDLVFEQIEAPNHRDFVAHEVSIICKNFEAFWSSFER